MNPMIAICPRLHNSHIRTVSGKEFEAPAEVLRIAALGG